MRQEFNFKKKWGQNFIKSTEVVLDAVEALDLHPTDRLIEIGPGNGAFTEFMAASVEYMRLIEIDSELIPLLTEKFGFLTTVEIIQQDVLKVDTRELISALNINKVFGALPYNISKQIVELFCGNYSATFDRCVFVLQKEVAHAYAGIGKKSTMLNQIYSVFNDIYLIEDIERSHFKPEPKVDSSLILFKSIPRSEIKFSETEIKLFIKFVKNCYRNPRKKLKKNLKAIYSELDWDKLFREINIAESARVEELGTDELRALFLQYKHSL